MEQLQSGVSQEIPKLDCLMRTKECSAMHPRVPATAPRGVTGETAHVFYMTGLPI